MFTALFHWVTFEWHILTVSYLHVCLCNLLHYLIVFVCIIYIKTYIIFIGIHLLSILQVFGRIVFIIAIFSFVLMCFSFVEFSFKLSSTVSRCKLVIVNKNRLIRAVMNHCVTNGSIQSNCNEIYNLAT